MNDHRLAGLKAGRGPPAKDEEIRSSRNLFLEREWKKGRKVRMGAKKRRIAILRIILLFRVIKRGARVHRIHNRIHNPLACRHTALQLR